MARFTEVIAVSDPCTTGNTVLVEIPITSNNIDIGMIDVTPDAAGDGTTEVFIHTKAVRGAGDLIFKTEGWLGDSFTDPVRAEGDIYYYASEGFVSRYEDEDATAYLHVSVKNNHTATRTYAIGIRYAETPFTANTGGVPGGLRTKAYSNLLECWSGVDASLNNGTIYACEFRAKYYSAGSRFPVSVDLRTAAEGGTFAHNGTTQLIVTDIFANKFGAQYSWVSGGQGRWYWAWRLYNTTNWSVWTDGNEVPKAVKDWFATIANQDSGPPEDWNVRIERSDNDNYYVVKTTRPRTNGKTILFWGVQVKDGSTGTWREVDADAGAADTIYDGSGADHTFNPDTGIFAAPVNWGASAIGELVLYDVRGNQSFTLEHCAWATIDSVSGTDVTLRSIGGGLRLLSTASQSGGVYNQIRVLVVRPPWQWDSEGYLGGEINRGMWGSCVPNLGDMLIDRKTRVFVSTPIFIPGTASAPEARVWFENAYSRSDDGATHSTGISSGDLDGYTWTSFTDRNYWFPALQQGENVALAFETGGTVTMSSGGTDPVSGTSKYGMAAIVGRFRILPATNGTVIVRAQFYVNFVNPNDEGMSGSPLALMLFMGMDGTNPIPYGNVDSAVHAFAALDNYGSATHRLRLTHCGGVSWSSIALSESTKVLYSTAMPSLPFTLDLRLTIKEDITNLNPFATVWQQYEYNIDGGGWNTITITPGTYMYAKHVPNYSYRGYRPALALVQIGTVAASYITLTEFQVSKGIIARR